MKIPFKREIGAFIAASALGSVAGTFEDHSHHSAEAKASQTNTGNIEKNLLSETFSPDVEGALKKYRLTVEENVPGEGDNMVNQLRPLVAKQETEKDRLDLINAWKRGPF